MFLFILLLILIVSPTNNVNSNRTKNVISIVKGFNINIVKGFKNRAFGKSKSSKKNLENRRMLVMNDNKCMNDTQNKMINAPILEERDEYIGYGNTNYPKKYYDNKDLNNDDDDDNDNDDDNGDTTIIQRSINNNEDSLMIPPVYLKDPYHYVRDDDRDNEEIVLHLKNENEYSDYMLKSIKEKGYEDIIYNELLSHIEETSSSYPYKQYDKDKYEYYSRTVQGESYCYHCRIDISATSYNSDRNEEIYLDENELANGKHHCDVEDVDISPLHDLVAYSVDYAGDETYSMYIKNLTSGELLESDTIHNMSGSLVWGIDNTVTYYSTLDDTDREYKLWMHRLGTSSDKDECIYTEVDPVYSINFYKTLSGRFLIIVSESHTTDECYYIDLTSKDARTLLKLIERRIPDIHYSVDHHGDYFYIITNRDNATNHKLVKAPISNPSAFNWVDVLPYDPLRTLEDIQCFKDFIVIYGRQDGLTQLWIMSTSNENSMSSADTILKNIHQLTFNETIYFIEPSTNMIYDTHLFRFTYSSMTTPTVLYDYDSTTKQLIILRQRPCPNYNPLDYQSKRLYAKANDDNTTLIPMSMLYKKSFSPFNDENNTDNYYQQPRPVHLYGYGSFGDCEEPEFDSSILPLLDRGVIFIVAHVRGGGEMGRSWYEDAKYLNKKRTFTDFISCAEHIIQMNITTSHLLTIEGRSAGGLLLGVVLNMRPDLFKAAITAVPFVDVMNTMMDSTIPLTVGEWVEWGNPNESKYFEYMLSYSPYDNVKFQPYPNIFITCGLHDTHVGFWEPTKWVAKLRQCNTNPYTNVLFKIDMTSGHSGSTDRYLYLRKKALDICYILDQLHLLDD